MEGAGRWREVLALAGRAVGGRRVPRQAAAKWERRGTHHPGVLPSLPSTACRHAERPIPHAPSPPAALDVSLVLDFPALAPPPCQVVNALSVLADVAAYLADHLKPQLQVRAGVGVCGGGGWGWLWWSCAGMGGGAHAVGDVGDKWIVAAV